LVSGGGGTAVAKFTVPDWGDKVNSGVGLSYQPARLHRLQAGIQQPYAGVSYIAQTRTMNLTAGLPTSQRTLKYKFLLVASTTL
jgi:hypothetical protein